VYYYFYGKKIAPNTFRKSKTPHHLQHFLAIPLYSKTNETSNTCACFCLTLFIALQSHLKEALTSNVSYPLQFCNLWPPICDTLIHSLIYSFIHSLTHLYTHSLTHSFIHSKFIHSFIHSKFIHSKFIHSFIHSKFIHSKFIHSKFIHSFKIHSFKIPSLRLLNTQRQIRHLINPHAFIP